jgi:surface polysaccharide O-acyltransferase-like enzyme
MITGVLFLNPEKDITLEKMLKKYVFRIVLAIILFGIPYCFMEIIFDANMVFNIGQIGVAILNAVQGKSWDHIWYLYMIAGLYLCIPLIKIFINFLYKFIKLTPAKSPLIIVIITVMSITILLSMGFSCIARKIKIIRKVVQ